MRQRKAILLIDINKIILFKKIRFSNYNDLTTVKFLLTEDRLRKLLLNTHISIENRFEYLKVRGGYDSSKIRA